jgi:hypothetical protein
MEIDWVNLLITPIVAAAVGIAVWYFQSRLEALRRAQDRLHDDRRKVYGDVLSPIIRAFVGVRNPKEAQKALQEIQSFDWRRTAFEFSLIGSDDVVRSFNNFMQYLYRFETAGPQQAATVELMRLWGAFLLEIRRNVGDPKTILVPVDMLKAQIKDIDGLFSESAS